MDISFKTAKLQKLCNSTVKLRGKHGPRQGPLIERRLLELSAIECLEDARALPGLRCHELTANLAGMLAVDLVHPDRLVFRPDHDPLPKDASGGLDWLRVTKIVVEVIGDYH